MTSQSHDQSSLFISSLLNRSHARAGEDKSGYSACLVQLLIALGWDGDPRHIVEALPHLQSHYDEIDVRNTLADLGYKSSLETVRLDTLDARLMPCILVAHNETPYVILSRETNGLVVFNGCTQVREILPFDQQRHRLIILYRQAEPNELKIQEPTPENWLYEIAQRFRPLFWKVFSITAVINFFALVAPLFVMLVYDRVVTERSDSLLLTLFIAACVALIVDFVLRLCRARVLAYIAGRAEGIISCGVFERLLKLPTQYIEMVPISGQISKLKELDAVREFFTGPMASLALEAPFIVIFLLTVFWIGGPIVFIPIVGTALFLVVAIVFQPKLKEQVTRSSQSRSLRFGFLIETATHLQPIRVQGMQSLWSERFKERSARSSTENFELARTTFTLETLSSLFMMTSGLLTAFFGAMQVIAGTLSLGGLIALMALTWRTLTPVQMALAAIMRFESVVMAAREINKIMRTKPEVSKNPVNKTGRRLKGKVSFSRVSMRYLKEAEPALFGVSFDVRENELVAITGNNGSGKSTVLKLILSLYRPQAGHVLIDGIDIRQIDPAELRHSIGYVPQRIDLFQGTVEQNLRLSNPAAPDEDMYFACQEADVLDDIMAMEKGFDTHINAHMRHQLEPQFIQKLGLARAYLKNSPILLLDEPGQYLTAEAAQSFLSALYGLSGQRTIIMVTHRMDFLRVADRILVMDGGRVVFSGESEDAFQLLGVNRENAA